MPTTTRTLAIIAVFFVSVAADNFSAWTHSATIQINTTASWANISGAVSDFPALVRLDSAVFNFAQTKPGGADIRFAKADGTTALPFEIESWDASSGRAALWVLIDTIAGNSSRQIRMFWGNPGAVSASRSSAVFDSIKGYLGVWHLSDLSSSATNIDATGRGCDGTKKPSASAIPLIETPLGTGQLYNETTQYTYTEISKGKVDLSNKSLSISAWIRRKGAGPGDYFIAEGTKDPRVGMRFGFNYQSQFTFNFLEGVGVDVYTKPMTENQYDWHCWVGTFDNTTKKVAIYCDGKLDTSGTVTSAFTGNDALTFCWAYGLSGEYLHASGTMDEVRISSNVRSADWIALEYANQKQGQALVGNAVAQGCTPDFGVAGSTYSIAEGAPLTLQGRAKCSQRFQWVRVDGTTESVLESNGVSLQPGTRVHGTSTVTYRFKALYDAGWQSNDVNVTIAEAIPEPEFTLNAPATFDGSDLTNPLIIAPIISNRAAVQASPAPAINFKWTVSGIPNFNMQNGDSLTIYLMGGEGRLSVRLCLDNGGDPICKESVVNVSGTGASGRGAFSGGSGLSLHLSGRALVADLPCGASGELRFFAPTGMLLFAHRFAGRGVHAVALPHLPTGSYIAELRTETTCILHRFCLR